MKEFLIPIDKEIRSFHLHLIANPRTIFSSKFGDGKSYFLDVFQKDEQVRKQYEFITIYPVNYQVVPNSDIFNLIKRDILFQLIVKNMISDQVVVPNDVALWFYLQTNYTSIIKDLLGSVSKIDLPAEYRPFVMLGIKSIKLFKDLKSKFDQFKKKHNDANLIEDFFSQINNNAIYENDIITTIIRKSIRNYKSRTGKEIVLVIEDLDRIDPAHLFRILNVFSAHIDYCYKNLVSSDNSKICGNKFDFDNVVLVADCDNIKNIFEHFYGNKTDFGGYISKFLSSTYFSYSLKNERYQYICDYLAIHTGCPLALLQKVLPNNGFDDKTIRDCVHSFDIENQIVTIPECLVSDKKVKIDVTFLKVIAAMRRLGLKNEDIRGIGKIVFDYDNKYFYEYIALYHMFLEETISGCAHLMLYDQDYGMLDVVVEIDENTGKGRLRSRSYPSTNDEKTDLGQIIEKMLEFIVQ